MAHLMARPQALAFVPAASLAAYWMGGEAALILTTLALPLLLSLSGPAAPRAAEAGTGLTDRATLTAALDAWLLDQHGTDKHPAAMAIAPDGLGELRARLGNRAVGTASDRVVDRIRATLRGDDLVARDARGHFVIALAPMRRADLETLLQISGRILDALREPVSIDGTTIYLSGVVGFCPAERSPDAGGTALISAAETAMAEARSHGAGAIRSFSAEMQRSIIRRHDLRGELDRALAERQIKPWFQPQLCTDTGRVSGFEALARWVHPKKGIIPPAEFLTALIETGLSARLTDSMLTQSLTAIRSWDRAGLNVPCVGVNFSGDELRNPDLVEKIRWELDRFSLSPDRLTVEILETVAADADDDMIVRNIAALADLGCGIDIDDFGTGNASIASIRRFAVRRLKIDRSFVTRVDRDPDQQNMVSAILTMAERLGLDTLAEGVETPGEHAVLAQLGCGHVQGYGIARPMPFEETIAWMNRHHEKLDHAAHLGQQRG
ncbi:putative bifunctional diguanylate cyclase/phosphodiesterase [Actibacterium sp. XHP0104]|uniref:putative bifunctional diguanylate cyclase/phosphodiesterase n=1 Tax=Actibacterium sp. XHP0104 TaxID=2984335 RepID=UPI0021E84C32|nr:GGDEF domain-containing phosphodiesterase [Actibacterium sp. XHP0104]MCV2882383.1 GGDEF domain-containing phosphodiesterase [Actibacterium sp. XHP0104]